MDNYFVFADYMNTCSIYCEDVRKKYLSATKHIDGHSIVMPLYEYYIKHRKCLLDALHTYFEERRNKMLRKFINKYNLKIINNYAKYGDKSNGRITYFTDEKFKNFLIVKCFPVFESTGFEQLIGEYAELYNIYTYFAYVMHKNYKLIQKQEEHRKRAERAERADRAKRAELSIWYPLHSLCSLISNLLKLR
jgi:hypothetical protein